MSQALRNAVRWAAGQAPRNNPTKRRNARIIVNNFAEDPTLAVHGNFVWGVIKFVQRTSTLVMANITLTLRQRNTQHTSHSDSRDHITLHLKTEEMIARKTTLTVHVYSKEDKNEEYEGFRIFEERPDKETDGEPGEPVE